MLDQTNAPIIGTSEISRIRHIITIVNGVKTKLSVFSSGKHAKPIGKSWVEKAVEIRLVATNKTKIERQTR